MNVLTTAWFWVLILSIIFFIIAVIMFQRYGQVNTNATSTPGWVWALFALAFILLLIAFILFIMYIRKEPKCTPTILPGHVIDPCTGCPTNVEYYVPIVPNPCDPCKPACPPACPPPPCAPAPCMVTPPCPQPVMVSAPCPKSMPNPCSQSVVYQPPPVVMNYQPPTLTSYEPVIYQTQQQAQTQAYEQPHLYQAQAQVQQGQTQTQVQTQGQQPGSITINSSPPQAPATSIVQPSATVVTQAPLMSSVGPVLSPPVRAVQNPLIAPLVGESVYRPGTVMTLR